MPEGDTVLRTARALDRALSGCVLEVADLRVPRHATADLVGGLVTGTASRGKHLLTRIDHHEPWTLHTHLKMEGSWHLYPTGRAWRRPDHQARVVLGVEGTTAVGFALGVVELVPRDAEASLVAHLGPDLLGSDWDEEEAVRRLLNSRRVVQSTTGDLRRAERTWVYRRDGRPCRRCGTTVQVSMRGPAGRERASYWCPSCQPAPCWISRGSRAAPGTATGAAASTSSWTRSAGSAPG